MQLRDTAFANRRDDVSFLILLFFLFFRAGRSILVEKRKIPRFCASIRNIFSPTEKRNEKESKWKTTRITVRRKRIFERKTGDPPINRGERRMIKLRPARDQRSARIASRPIFTAVKIVSSSLEDRRIDGRRFKEEFGEREREGKERKSRTYDRTDWFRAEKNYGENTKKKKRREEKRNTTHLDHHRSSTCTRYSPWMAAWVIPRSAPGPTKPWDRTLRRELWSPFVIDDRTWPPR